MVLLSLLLLEMMLYYHLHSSRQLKSLAVPSDLQGPYNYMASITLKFIIPMDINEPSSMTTSPTISPDLQRKAATMMLVLFSPELS